MPAILLSKAPCVLPRIVMKNPYATAPPLSVFDFAATLRGGRDGVNHASTVRAWLPRTALFAARTSPRST
jgi:hypothetical protein